MSLTLNQFEVLTFIEKNQDNKITQRDISKNCRISLGNVNSINVSSLPQGLYMVIVNFDDSQEAYKIYRK